MKEIELRRLASLELGDNWAIWHLQKVRYFQSDIFGVFDFIAINKITHLIMLVQLTTLSNASKRRNKIYDWLRENNLNSFQNVWLWLFDPHKNVWRKENIFI